jgi:hypothetical protein
MDLRQAVEEYHRAADEFSRGNPEPVKALLSDRDDVTLANPFGPAVRGRQQVSEALDYASARFSDGEVTGFENLATYATSALASILEIEQWKAKVGDSENVTSFELRVTSTFRRRGRHLDARASPRRSDSHAGRRWTIARYPHITRLPLPDQSGCQWYRRRERLARR